MTFHVAKAELNEERGEEVEDGVAVAPASVVELAAELAGDSEGSGKVCACLQGLEDVKNGAC